jgi:feruloyl esterase
VLKGIFTTATLLLCSASVWAAGTSCEGLAKLNIPHVEVTSASYYASGAFNPSPGGGPGAQNQNAIYKMLSSFCRVQITSHPTSDSDIKIEIWLPGGGWNGRMAVYGNGAFGSNIGLANLAQAIAKGYIGTANNTGHDTNDGAFAVGHPEKFVDWGYRAVHENVVIAKAVAAAYYGSPVKYSYWNSCSTGGRQGWIAAEYYPNDFDGLAIGDAANPMSRLQANSIWSNLQFTATPESMISSDKFKMIHQAVIDQCDEKDGLKDGLVTDYRVCNFPIDSLLCKDGDTPNCLTAPQITALKNVIAGSRLSTGEQVYAGFPVGETPGITAMQKPEQVAIDTIRALYQDASWDYHTLDVDKDIPKTDKLAEHLINAVDYTKLQVLFGHGGKILYYHGWNDGSISALSAIDYYNKVVQANGGVAKTYDDVRLFMIPGGNHCGGGEGPNAFDKLDVISDWVERGKAPDEIIASHAGQDGKVDRTRPLCPYPQVAQYKGTGSIDEAQNFVCAKP